MDDRKLCGAVDMQKGWDAIQGDLHRFEQWAKENFMTFSKAKILHRSYSNSHYQYKLLDELIEHSPTGKDMGFIVDGWT